jgi:multiple sugar transport system permease protein
MTTTLGSSGAGRHRRKPVDGWRWAGRIFLVFMLIFTVVPMAWMLLTSFKTGFAAAQFPPQWWPTEPTLASYVRLLDPQNSVGKDFLHYFWNSLFVSTTTTLLAVAVAVPAAYAFSRFNFPGRTQLMLGYLVVRMFPAVLISFRSSS